mgnify:CR=1 FL=1|jgi:hypothetical protein
MTRKFIFPIFISLSLILVLIGGCSKDEDNTKPIIQVAEPEEGDTLLPGTTLHFEADFSDDTELKSYKIDIHGNFDNHTHKSVTADSTVWSYQNSWAFESGMKQSHVHQHDITIPLIIDGLPIRQGNYHFMIYLTDKAGNESWIAIPVVINKNGTVHPE